MKPLKLMIAGCALMLIGVAIQAQQVASPPEADPEHAGAATESRFDVQVENAPARPFFQGLVEGTRYNMIVLPEVGGNITLTLKHVTIEDVLEATREMYGYDYRRTSASFIVLPPTVQSRVFHLRYLDLKRYGVSNTRISSGQVTQSGNNSQYGNTVTSGQTPTMGVDAQGRPTDVTGTSIITHGDSDFWSGIEADLHALIGSGPGRDVVVNRQSGVIVVRAMPNELREVGEYLQRTSQIVMRQVIIEAKIVEVDLNDAYQAGINWTSILTSNNAQYTFGQSTPPNGFAGNPLTPTNNPYIVAPGHVVNGFPINTLGGAFTLAANIGNFNAFIELLNSQGRTRVLSSPRVSTLHNQQAIIKAGTDQFFVTNVQSNTVTGTATSTSQNVQLTPFFSGVALDVTPEIGEDGDLTLHVHPTVSEVTDQNTTLTVNGTVTTIPLALSQIRESDNIVKAHSGQLIIIGGLMREEVSKIAYKTPILGDIPGLGKLFRSDQNQKQTSELVILLRPIVVSDANWPSIVSESEAPVQELNQRADLGPLDLPKDNSKGTSP